jgi:hypothetical protein
MYRRSADSDREVQSGSTGGRESGGSTRTSPVETLHRQVGNQAMQNSYAEEEYPEPTGASGQDGSQGTAMVGGREGMSIPDEHGPQRAGGLATGTGSVSVAGWQTVTIPGKSIPDEHGPQRAGGLATGTGSVSVAGWQTVEVPGWLAVELPSITDRKGQYRDRGGFPGENAGMD